MPKSGPGNILFILFFIAITIGTVIFLIMNTAIPGSGEDTGTLTGNVTIGPLCPVEPCSVTPEQLAAAFAARTIVVTDRGGLVVVTAIPDPKTGYSVELKPGSYRVDIGNEGIDQSPELPETVTIREGETVRLDISIDTGIR